MSLRLARMRRRVIDRPTRIRHPTTAAAVVRIQRQAEAIRRLRALRLRVTRRRRGPTPRLVAVTPRLRAPTLRRAVLTPRPAAVTAVVGAAMAVAAVVEVHAAAVAAALTAAVVVRTEAAVAHTATVTKKSLEARPAPCSGAGLFCCTTVGRYNSWCA